VKNKLMRHVSGEKKETKIMNEEWRNWSICPLVLPPAPVARREPESRPMLFSCKKIVLQNIHYILQTLFNYRLSRLKISVSQIINKLYN